MRYSTLGSHDVLSLPRIIAVAAIVVVSAQASTAPAQVAAPAEPLSTPALATAWDHEHLASPLPPLLTDDDVAGAVGRAVEMAPDLVRSEIVGRSVEGRDIHHLWLGRGPMSVLLWSQMHGDEPTATVALFDVIEHIRLHEAEPRISGLLDALTLHIVPMLNPDGAARHQRRNAQGLDVNRDALMQQSPEGRILKALRDRLRPAVGFNLHNQSWRTSVGAPPRPAALSLLSVAYDDARSENEGRRLTKRICAAILDAVEPLAPGMIGRYDDEFEVRAFGDNVTKWGTPVVLIETGPYPSREPDEPLVRLNFVALLSALDALATGRVRDADPRRYRGTAAQLGPAVLDARHARERGGRDGGRALHRRHRHRGHAGHRRQGWPAPGLVVRDDRGPRRPPCVRRARDHRRDGPHRRPVAPIRRSGPATSSRSRCAARG